MEPPVASFFYSDLLWLLLALVLCALFSFLETSLTALRLFNLKEIAQNINNRYRSLFHTLETNPNRILITVLVASNLCNVIAAVLSEKIIASMVRGLSIPDRLGFAIGIILTTTTILIVELVPKNLAISHGKRLFSSTLWLTNVIYYMFYHFVTFLLKFTNTATQLIGGSPTNEVSEAVTSEKEIQFLIDYINEKGLMERHKTAMLKSIFELGTTAIREIMIPETQIISINANSSQQDILDMFSKYQFTRMPVYEDSADNVIGMLHQKDFFQLLSKKEDKPLRDILRPIVFIPESAKVLSVLKQFIDQRMHIAMVLNEFGSIIGLVTLEDVIEEIVGEISDEYEAIPEKIVTLPSGGWVIDASIDLEDLGLLLGIEFEAEDALTLSGFLTEQFQHLPQKDEELVYKNYHFKIQQATPKKILQVLVFPASQSEHFHELE